MRWVTCPTCRGSIGGSCTCGFGKYRNKDGIILLPEGAGEELVDQILEPLAAGDG